MSAELKDILSSLTLEAVLDHHGIDYRHRTGSRGPQLNIKTCPCCGNNKWKVYASEETGLGNCFSGSCSMRTFNLFSFTRQLLGGAGNGEVFTHLQRIATEQGWRPKRVAAATSVEVDEWAMPSSIPLPDEFGSNLEYLERRGVDADLCRYFQLSYCHTGGFAANINGQDVRQDYSQRVLIPVFDLEGKLVTFQGRDITGAKEPKYQFPPGLPASGRYLYNGHNAWRAKQIVLGEGAFDVIAIKKALDEQLATRDVIPVGTFGMHLSDGTDGSASQMSALIELKRAGLEVVTFMWDGEKRALRSALEAAQRVRRVGLRARVAVLPLDHDPNEVPPEVVREALWRAEEPTGAGLARLLQRTL